MWDPEAAGVDEAALCRFIDEQIYSLPGTDHHRDVFTVLLTGSRGAGIHTPESDVDIDVLCSPGVYESVHRASLKAGIIQGESSFMWTLKDDDWARYFGQKMGRPHFSLTSLDRVKEHFRDRDDVFMWIWTNAQAIADPNRQFQRICDAFEGYPAEVLVRKIKYHWLLFDYWDVDVYPYHHSRGDEMLAASLSLLNAVNELLRLFFLVDGRPFPYTEKLMRVAPMTTLGEQFVPMLRHVVDLALGMAGKDLGVWERLDKAHELLCVYDKSEECRRLTDACQKAMVGAGVCPQWVEADYGNIDELLLGELGPMP
ncbi:MAG: DUF4037 domain-containing protein [Planctomycetota bacterium]|jgi:hypothetical protein